MRSSARSNRVASRRSSSFCGSPTMENATRWVPIFFCTDAVWARQRDGWWPAFDQAGYSASYPGEARPYAHPWSWAALVAEHGPVRAFVLPDAPDTGSIPRQDA